MLSALIRAFAQLTDPRVQRIMWLALGLALGVLLALGLLLWLVIAKLQLVTLPWLDWLIEAGTELAIAVLLWFLFPAAVSATIGLFLESVAEAVEARHYPALGKPREQPIHEAVLAGSKFALVALLINMAALPVYIVGVFVAPLNFFVFYGLNGYLLGREYFETVALRRLDPKRASELRRREKWRVFLAGVIITLLLTVPFLNLIAPVIATAFMLHLFESVRRAAAPTR